MQDWFRTRLNLPDGQLAAIAGVQTFGDYLGFHPHLHVIAPAGLIDKDGNFHEMPIESVKPLEEVFRHRFLAALRREKLISETKQSQLMSWTHSGFNLDAGEDPIASHDPEGRRRLAEYLLHPVLLGKDHLEPKRPRIHHQDAETLDGTSSGGSNHPKMNGKTPSAP